MVRPIDIVDALDWMGVYFNDEDEHVINIREVLNDRLKTDAPFKPIPKFIRIRDTILHVEKLAYIRKKTSDTHIVATSSNVR